MADPNDIYLADPIRPGAAPTISIPETQLKEIAGAQPLYVRMTEALLRVLRAHFSAAARIEFPQLVDRVWTNAESSPIFIGSLAEWKPAESSKRPSLLVDRLDQEPDQQRRVLGMQFQGVKPGNYFQFMNGHHVVHCLGGREGEAEYLAAEVWRELTRFGPKIQRYLCLTRFTPERVTKRKQLSDEHREHYVTSIPIFYHWSESWTIKPLDEEEVTQVMTSVTFGS